MRFEGLVRHRVHILSMFLLLLALFVGCEHFEENDGGAISMKREEIKQLNHFREMLGTNFKKYTLESISERKDLVYSYTEDPGWEENKGQIPHPEVRYYARTSFGYVVVTRNSIIYFFVFDTKMLLYYDNFNSAAVVEEKYRNPFNLAPCDEIAVGNSINYVIGENPKRWTYGVKRYRSLCLGEVSPGVELELMLKGGRFVKVYHVKDVTGLRDLSIEYIGCKDLLVSNEGELVLENISEWYDIYFSPPRVIKNGQSLTGLEYVKEGKNRLSIGVVENKTMEIPFGVTVEVYASGSSDIFHGYAYLATSEEGVYVAGEVPIFRWTKKRGPVDYFEAFKDLVYICRYDKDLKLIAKTYISADIEGGIGVSGISVFPKRGIYIVGEVSSDRLPGSDSGYCAKPKGGNDVYVLLMSFDLKRVLSATYLGSDSYDVARGIAVTRHGVYVFGETVSLSFPHNHTLGGNRSFDKDAGDRYSYICFLSPGLEECKNSWLLKIRGGIEMESVSEDGFYLIVKDRLFEGESVPFNLFNLAKDKCKGSLRGRIFYLLYFTPGLESVRGAVLDDGRVFSTYSPNQIIFKPVRAGYLYLGVTEYPKESGWRLFPCQNFTLKGFCGENLSEIEIFKVDRDLKVQGAWGLRLSENSTHGRTWSLALGRRNVYAAGGIGKTILAFEIGLVDGLVKRGWGISFSFYPDIERALVDGIFYVQGKLLLLGKVAFKKEGKKRWVPYAFSLDTSGTRILPHFVELKQGLDFRGTLHSINGFVYSLWVDRGKENRPGVYGLKFVRGWQPVLIRFSLEK